jgi:hypothetical protein
VINRIFLESRKYFHSVLTISMKCSIYLVKVLKGLYGLLDVSVMKQKCSK